jgi:hypothetical protein
MTTAVRWTWLNNRRLLTALTFLAIFAFALRYPLDSDSWWHLRSGQFIWETGTIPQTDPFSFTRGGSPWIDHGWLAQLFWYGLYRIGGLTLLSLALAVIVTLCFIILWRVAEGNVFIRAFSFILGAIVSSIVWIARPQILSLLLAAISLAILYSYKRRGSRAVYALPFVAMLWANIHGGYAILFMLIAAFLAGEGLSILTNDNPGDTISRKQWWLLFGMMILSFGLVAVNPYGLQMWFYPFKTMGISALRDFIQEWRSPDFHQPIIMAFLVMLIVTLTALGRAGRKAFWTDIFVIALWAGWSLYAARNIGLFGLLIAPLLATYASQAWGQLLPGGETDLRGKSLLAGVNWMIILLALLAVTGFAAQRLSRQATTEKERQTIPVDAVRAVQKQHPAGLLFNSYNWGGYVLFSLYPDYKVYIDGRTDLYDDALMREYLDVWSARGEWRRRLDDAGINLVMVETQSPLSERLNEEHGWELFFKDEMVVVYSRKTAGSQ